MNLLIDAWIPIRDENGQRQISYRDILCKNQDWQISLPRDDMELACLQLLICLTQVIFMPADKIELRKRINETLTGNEFQDGINRNHYLEWFDLDHEKTPFMQTINTGAKKTTPIQKLFIGLPEGNNDAFFNDPQEMTNICGGCAAIALFNQNINSPNFSGKHKGGLRGAAPITTLISKNNVQQSIWANVLSRKYLENHLPTFLSQEVNNKPVWVEAIDSIHIKENPKNKKPPIYSNEIGLARGLFWLPVLIRLVKTNSAVSCNCCGNIVKDVYPEFYLGSNYLFDVNGTWPHPHNPREFGTNTVKQIENAKKKGRLLNPKYERSLSFTTTAPAWTRFAEFLFENGSPLNENDGFIRAPVIDQWAAELSDNQRLHLLVGGYRNKQAAILQRRHENFSISSGWDKKEIQDQMEKIIGDGLKVKDVLCEAIGKVISGIKKLRLNNNRTIKVKGTGMNIKPLSEQIYYQRTEQLINELLREMDRKEYRKTRQDFVLQLCNICGSLFEEVTKPYSQNPELLRIVVIGRKKMFDELYELKKGVGL